MRILYTYSSLAVWGGIERVLVDKMNYLVTQKKYDVYMLTTCQGHHPIPYAIDPKVHIEDLGIQFHIQYQYSGLRRLIDAFRRIRLFEKKIKEKLHELHPDIIICTTADPVFSIVKVKSGVPLIVESHSICQRIFYTNGLYQRFRVYLLRKGLQKASCIVALTEGDAIDWRKIHPHVEVIPNLVHLNDGTLSSLSTNRVVFVGRFDYQKRPMEAIKIWQKVYPYYPNWHLDIFGDGEQRSEIMETASRLNMNIHIYPPTKRIFEYYRNSSILLSTSLYEPFGLVISEAMSCGLPIVSYDCPSGPSSIILDGLNGFLVKMDDQEMMSKKLKFLMGNLSLRQKMGKMAFLSSSRYSAQIIMPFWTKLFDRLVSCPR